MFTKNKWKNFIRTERPRPRAAACLEFRIADCERMKKELEARTKRFALSAIEFVGKLPRRKASDVIGYQLVKSGTSIGANYREANRAQSHDDFIHKLAICEKEAAETEYWLELAVEANLVGPGSTEELLQEIGELLSQSAIRNPKSEIPYATDYR
jgi:four helix bundle protein